MYFYWEYVDCLWRHSYARNSAIVSTCFMGRETMKFQTNPYRVTVLDQCIVVHIQNNRRGSDPFGGKHFVLKKGKSISGVDHTNVTATARWIYSDLSI
jgi:hypothetical protein